MARVMGLALFGPAAKMVDKGKLGLKMVRRPPDCDAAAAGPPGKHLLCA